MNTTPKVVVLDVGHNATPHGHDVGASHILKEADVNKLYADALEKILKEKGYIVYRTDDPNERSTNRFRLFSNFKSRFQVAYKHDADLYIPIHADVGGSGTAVYQCSNSSEQSVTAAGNIIASLQEGNFKVKGDVQHLHKHRQGPLINLDKDIPAFLVETMCVTNSQDCANVQDPVYMDKFATAFVNGIDNFFAGNPIKKREHNAPDNNVIVKSDTRYQDCLAACEGNYQSVNESGHLGKYQFSPQTLSMFYPEILNENGTVNAKAKKHFLNSPELQEEVERKHIAYLDKEIQKRGLDKYLDKPFTINGRTFPRVTLSGMRNVGHLLGAGGMENFFENGIDGEDGNATPASAYLSVGYLTDMTNRSPQECKEVAYNIADSKNYSELTNYANNPSYNSNIALNTSSAGQGGSQFVYSKAVEDFQVAYNEYAAKHGLKKIRKDGKMGEETWNAAITAGVSDNLANMMNISDEQKGILTASAGEHKQDAFIKFNHTKDYISSTNTAFTNVTAAIVHKEALNEYAANNEHGNNPAKTTKKHNSVSHVG